VLSWPSKISKIIMLLSIVYADILLFSPLCGSD
jgi:hypothetical protein